MTQVTRRSFIKNAGGAGVALWLGMTVKGFAQTTQQLATANNFTPFILVESNGNITLFNPKPEMGQGTFQSIPALIAEEFEVSLDEVTIKNTSGEKEFGNGQSAGGSRSVVTSYTAMRKVGASAREVFIQAAANRWQVKTDTCYAAGGKVYHKPSSKSLTYGDLVSEAALLELPKEPALKDPKNFSILGKQTRRPDVPMKTNGSAQFGLDMKVDGMLYASVERCKVIGGTLKDFDATEALKTPGVRKVVAVERVFGRYKSTGVAVVANTYWATLQARRKLVIEWDTRGFETFNSTDYEQKLRGLAGTDGLVAKETGAVEGLQLKPENVHEAFYETPMVAHHPMETMNCITHVNSDKVEIWTSTQVPGSITSSGNNNEITLNTGFQPQNITLHTAFIGGGFGRRLNIDYVIEAVNLAKQVPMPVKLVWTREDTTEVGPYRAMTFSQMKAGFSSEGKLLMFQHKLIGPSHREVLTPNYDRSKADPAMSEGIGDQPYEIPNLKASVVRADFHVPLAAWRSVISATSAFAHESFIDELALKSKQDPLLFRLSLLTKASDARRVLLKLREFSGWDKPLAKGRGRGVAQWEFFAGLCSQVVEVSYRPDKSIRIEKVYAVIDLGEVVNIDNVKNQIEGAIVMALGAATNPGITFRNGMVNQHNFYDSPVPRINEVPPIEVLVLAEGGKLKGVGEPGVPPFAPALTNAIFAASGIRIRKLPIDLRHIG